MTDKSANQEVSDNVLRFITNRWSRRVVQPILIALLNTSLFIALAVVIFIVTGNNAWLQMPFLVFILMLEGVYTTLWLHHPSQRITDNMAYRAAELVVIVLITRVFTWIISGTLPDIQLYETYLRRPFLLFSGTLFVLGVCLIVSVWVRSIDLTITFITLSIDQGEASYYLSPKLRRSEDGRPFQLDRSTLVRSFFRQWIWGGVLLAILAAMSTFDLPQLENWNRVFSLARLGLMPEMLLALLVYFLSGFLLLSQARLAAVNARWLHDGVTKHGEVERSWHRYSLRLLLIVALIASLLPLGNTTGISRILESILFVITAVASFVTFLFFGLLAMLIPQASPEEAGAITPTPEIFPTVPPVTPAPPTQPNETIEIIFSSAFWAVAIVLTIMAVSFFLRERGVRFNSVLLRRVWTALRTWLGRVWQQLSVQAGDLRQTVQQRLQTIRPSARKKEKEQQRPFRFLRINALPPRERIRYFYLSTVQRAEEKGIPRRDDETPLEFAQDLKEQFPDAEIDVEELTDAFVKARYTPQPIEEEEVDPVKKRWKQMRGRLRRNRRRQDESTAEDPE